MLGVMDAWRTKTRALGKTEAVEGRGADAPQERLEVRLTVGTGPSECRRAGSGRANDGLGDHRQVRR